MQNKNEVPIQEMSTEEAEALWNLQQANEFALPKSKYSERFQASVNEKLLNIKQKYGCSDAEATVKLVKFSA